MDLSASKTRMEESNCTNFKSESQEFLKGEFEILAMSKFIEFFDTCTKEIS